MKAPWEPDWLAGSGTQEAPTAIICLYLVNHVPRDGGLKDFRPRSNCEGPQREGDLPQVTQHVQSHMLLTI